MNEKMPDGWYCHSCGRGVAQAGEPVAWRILCTNNGATGNLYTEKLPFEPGPGVRQRKEPEPLYLGIALSHPPAEGK